MPALGAAIRGEWALDSDWLTVNHGSYGAVPKPVLAAQQDWRRQMEAQPTYFFSQVFPGAVRKAAAVLGAFVGVKGEDIAFVTNATEGCNAVLRSMELRPGDEVLVLTHGYGAVRNTVHYVTGRAGARMTQAALPFPDPDERRVLAALEAVLTRRTRLAVLDHITSASALVLPIAAMTALCRAAGVPVLIDGAHGPGQVTLDVPVLGADWYAGNCHKWLCAPKGCGFLWAAPERRANLHPVTLSHGLGRGFLAEFDWTGTRDPSAWLAVDAAVAFHEHLGGLDLRVRNATLASEATALLARRLRTDVGASGAFAGAMGVVRLPISATPERTRAICERLVDARTDAPVQALEGALWLRISAAAYNERADYERLADIVEVALHE